MSKVVVSCLWTGPCSTPWVFWGMFCNRAFVTQFCGSFWLRIYLQIHPSQGMTGKRGHRAWWSHHPWPFSLTHPKYFILILLGYLFFWCRWSKSCFAELKFPFLPRITPGSGQSILKRDVTRYYCCRGNKLPAGNPWMSTLTFSLSFLRFPGIHQASGFSCPVNL